MLGILIANNGVGFFGPFEQIRRVWIICILPLMFCAYTRDFTVRVKAISTGMILPPGVGRNPSETRPHESPLSGRSARSICWLMMLITWVALGSLLIGKASKKAEAGPYYEDLFENRLPICTWLVPFVLSAAILMWVNCKSKSPKCSAPWLADLILLICSCTPAALIFADYVPIYEGLGLRPELLHLEYVFESQRWVRSTVFVSQQVLVQAGCHPLLCLCPCALLPLHIAVCLNIAYQQKQRGNRLLLAFDTVAEASVIVSCIIWITSSIDYLNRYRAIREALQRAQQNAASTQSLLDRVIINPSCSGLELQHIQQLTPDPVAEPPGASVAVAVVRHAERADAAHALDDWGCSEDATKFPYDPPITAEGVQQAKDLARDLKQQLVSLDVIISSPYLRCVQTAEVLAEEFDVLVLLDAEVGEVMGPTAFELQPTARRPWAKLISKCRGERIKAGRTLGKEPKWPETLKDARIRYAKRFLDYLKRSRHTKKSCIIVTHGHMLPVCASILPATHHLQVNGVDYAAALLATCRSTEEAMETADGPGRRFQPKLRRAASFDSATGREVQEWMEPKGRSEMLRVQNAVVHDARIKYWSVWLKGLRTSSRSLPNSMAIVRELQTCDPALGLLSWQDIVQLLGLLPSAPCDVEGSDDDAASFHTDTRTMSSMAYFRDPTGMKSSPPSVKSASDASASATAPPKAPAVQQRFTPQLNLGASRLASRRKLPPIGLKSPTDSWGQE
eukprot:Skav234924  [mRNA]  locus=scaffold840:964194:966398:+ [translate_table: standard]